MTYRSWIVRTTVAIGIILLANFAVAIVADPYGLFRDPAGRQLRVAFAGRKAKFLLSKRYVPANYDALLIGPSSSENWDPSAIPGVTMYNESELGSNVVEEKRIVDQAVPQGHFKLAVCILYPTMTTNHAINDGLDEVTTAEALGSIHLFVHETTELLSILHLPAGRLSSPNGATPLKTLPPNVVTMQYEPGYFHLDPVAVTSYIDLVSELKSHGTRIVYVVPPLHQPCLKLNQAAFDNYKATMLQALPEGQVIDLNGPEFLNFRSDAGNYVDCFHANASGAAKISTYLAQQVPQLN